MPPSLLSIIPRPNERLYDYQQRFAAAGGKVDIPVGSDDLQRFNATKGQWEQGAAETSPGGGGGGGGGGAGGGGPVDTPSMSGLGDASGAGTEGAGALRGPSRYRQGIGTRIPPNGSMSLAALKQIY